MTGNTKNEIKVLVQGILAAITQKYVMTDSKIPSEVLALKDEVMDIFEKSQRENDPEKLRQYGRRLAEIRESVAPDDLKGQL